MVLDTATLRVGFGVVALTMLVLFYLVTYRTTRSAYCGWWCASLGLFVVGASAYLPNGTVHQVWANPLGNVLVVLGAGCVWAGARSLRTSAPARWQLATLPAIVGLLSAIDDPADNVWAGGPYFLAAMWIMLGLAARELWRLERSYPAAAAIDGNTYRLALRSMTVACALVAVYYLVRWGVFLAVGQDDHLFTAYFGGQATTLISTVLLATASFSMSTLSNEQQTAALRVRATQDGLTGLLNRTEFFRLATEEMRRMRRTGDRTGDGAQLILADLDHFKRINDEQGHQAGDRALVIFADACLAAVRASDLVGRYGGEEFILLLTGASPRRAEQVTAAIDASLRRTSSERGLRLPTASYGVTTVDVSAGLERNIGFADSALYRAKEAGRNRSIRYAPDVA